MKNKNVKTKKKMKKYHWLIIFIITTFIAMYIYGMTKVYLPDPVHIGLGQYFDLATGVIIIALLFSGFVIGMLFKKKEKRGN